MPKIDSLAETAIKAKEMGMSYGQYATYLACHRDESLRSKSPYANIERRKMIERLNSQIQS